MRADVSGDDPRWSPSVSIEGEFQSPLIAGDFAHRHEAMEWSERIVEAVREVVGDEWPTCPGGCHRPIVRLNLGNEAPMIQWDHWYGIEGGPLLGKYYPFLYCDSGHLLGESFYQPMDEGEISSPPPPPLTSPVNSDHVESVEITIRSDLSPRGPMAFLASDYERNSHVFETKAGCRVASFYAADEETLALRMEAVGTRTLTCSNGCHVCAINFDWSKDQPVTWGWWALNEEKRSESLDRNVCWTSNTFLLRRGHTAPLREEEMVFLPELRLD